MKHQTLILALLTFLASPAHGDDVADWWKDYATNVTLVKLPDGKQLGLFCQGEGTPVVMLEAGLGPQGITAWRRVHTAIGRVTKTCAYNRPGTWNSAPTDSPRDAGTEADDLAALLKAADLPAPYVVVGHSYGGYITRLYVGRHTSDVAGLLLVDPSYAYQADRVAAAIPAWVNREAENIAVFKDCAIDPRPANLVAKCQPMPPADVPQEMTQRYFDSNSPAYNSHGLREREAMNKLSSDLLTREKRNLGALPFVVLSRDPSLLGAGLSADEAKIREWVWMQGHIEMMDISSDSQLVVVPGAGHSIQFDRPDAVINAVTDMVAKVRNR